MKSPRREAVNPCERLRRNGDQHITHYQSSRQHAKPKLMALRVKGSIRAGMACMHGGGGGGGWPGLAWSALVKKVAGAIYMELINSPSLGSYLFRR